MILDCLLLLRDLSVGIMTHGPTRIPSKGACIYCGARDVKLTDEHIVPRFLAGVARILVLRRPANSGHLKNCRTA